MVNKRDIGEVFSDSLQDFEQAPPNADKIWDGITSELELSQDNDKAAPIWWRGAGLGLLAIGLIATLAYFGPSWFGSGANSNQEQLTTEQSSDGFNNNNTSNTPIVAGDGDTDQNTNQNNANSSTKLDDAVTTQDAVTENTFVETNTNNVDNTVQAEQRKVSGTTSATITDNNSALSNTRTGVSQNNTSANSNVVSGNTPSTDSRNNTEANNTTSGITTNPAAVNLNDNSAIGQTTLTNNRNSSNVPARGFYVLNKSSLKKQPVATTSFTVAPAPTQGELAEPLPVIGLTYENIVKAKKSKAMRALEREIRTREALDYKWTVGAVVAPTTYGSVTRGSMLDARLVDNPRQGETNLSYGIKVKNQFTPKSALRFGINKINLGYNTQNFQVNVIDGIVNIYQLTGIDPGQEISDGISLNAEATEFFAANDVVGIDQQISYIEFPLEYEYAFINSRFGANLIGGSSLIVLSDNRIFATSQEGQNLDVGSASDLTGLGYTLNLGLGLDYEISKNIQFNVDPIFKLQLNGPNNSATNNFRPYYFGIYSGLSFKF